MKSTKKKQYTSSMRKLSYKIHDCLQAKRRHYLQWHHFDIKEHRLRKELEEEKTKFWKKNWK